MVELQREARGDFKSFLRVDPDLFLEILGRVEHRITKSSEARPPLKPGLKLAITLRYLATGDTYRSLAFSFRVAHNTISLFIPQVCDAIVDEFRDEHFHTPGNEAECLPLELSSCLWCLGWKTCPHKETKEEW